MTDDEVRAHGVLHGQSLLPEWRECCRLDAEGNRLYGMRGMSSVKEAKVLWARIIAIWQAAIVKEFGYGVEIRWTHHHKSTLSNGEVYNRGD